MNNEEFLKFQSTLVELVKPWKRTFIGFSLKMRADKETVYSIFEGQSWADSGFPREEYNDSDAQTHFQAVGKSIEEAKNLLKEEIAKEIIVWRERFRVDDAFKLGVGKRVILLQKHITKTFMHIEKDTEGVVVSHIPGYLYINFCEGARTVPMAFWNWTSYNTHYEDKDGNNTKTVWHPGGREVKDPCPYIRFADGYEPWRK